MYNLGYQTHEYPFREVASRSPRRGGHGRYVHQNSRAVIMESVSRN